MDKTRVLEPRHEWESYILGVVLGINEGDTFTLQEIEEQAFAENKVRPKSYTSQMFVHRYKQLLDIAGSRWYAGKKGVSKERVVNLYRRSKNAGTLISKR